MGKCRVEKRSQVRRKKIRTMARPPRYEKYDFVALLLDEYKHVPEKMHENIFALIRANKNFDYKIVSNTTWRKKRSRVYLTDELSLVLFNMMFGEHVWKMYRLV